MNNSEIPTKTGAEAEGGHDHQTSGSGANTSPGIQTRGADHPTHAQLEPDPREVSGDMYLTPENYIGIGVGLGGYCD